MRFDIIINAFLYYAVAIMVWFLTGIIVGNLEPVILTWKTTFPFWFSWYDYYQTIYQWVPIMMLIVPFFYIYTNNAKSQTNIPLK